MAANNTRGTRAHLLEWMVGIAIVANLALYLFVVRPMGQSSAGLDDRAKSAAASAQSAESEAAAASRLLAQREQTESQLEEFYSTILPADVSSARRLTYTSLPALAQQVGVRYQRRRFDVAPAPEDAQLTRMTIRVELQGQYAAFRDFIYELEKSADFVIIDEMALTEIDPSGPLALSITLSTYYPTGANEF